MEFKMAVDTVTWIEIRAKCTYNVLFTAESQDKQSPRSQYCKMETVGSCGEQHMQTGTAVNVYRTVFHVGK